MKIAARFAVALSGAGMGFLSGFAATFVVNLAVFGFGRFEGDAGAKVIGFVLGLLGFWLGARRSRHLPLDKV
jgi:hypothetical protein